MKIAAKKESNALVVTVSGRMDAVTAPEFEKSIAAFIAQGEKAFVINLGGLEYISSAGLRSVLLLGKTLQDKGGALRLANLGGMVTQVFELSGFSALFPTFDSVASAIL